jgi:hypothetical protein
VGDGAGVDVVVLRREIVAWRRVVSRHVLRGDVSKCKLVGRTDGVW